jgi:hypothetical protein
MRLLKYVVVFFLVAAVWFGYQKRMSIIALWWHVAHHGTLQFGPYSVPVPLNWYVHDFAAGDKLLFRLNRDPRTLQAGQYPVAVDVLDRPSRMDLNVWIAQSVAGAQQDKNQVQRRDFSFNGEKMVCLAEGPGANPAAARSWRCRSSDRLELLLTAPEADMGEVWKIVSGIRRSE